MQERLRLSECRGNNQSHCGTEIRDQGEPPEHPWVFTVQTDPRSSHLLYVYYHWIHILDTITYKILRSRLPDIEEKNYVTHVNYLSMFLLFALRRATIPALASASKENGSMPYTESKYQPI